MPFLNFTNISTTNIKMVLISEKYRFIYIKNIKVGGTSVEDFFAQYCAPPGIYKSLYYSTDNQKDCYRLELITSYGLVGKNPSNWTNQHISKNIKSFYTKSIFHDQHAGSKCILENFPGKFVNFFKFCVVRNPFDRMVSWYEWEKKCKTTLLNSFREFILNESANKINKMNCDWYHRITLDCEPICDFYIKFENLEKDILEVCKKLDIKDVNINELKHFKQSEDKAHYSTYYDEELIDIVSTHAKEELEYFNYKFEREPVKKTYSINNGQTPWPT